MTGRVDEQTPLIEPAEDPKRRLGPLEISTSQRRWILFGVWMAQCFGVSDRTQLVLRYS